MSNNQESIFDKMMRIDRRWIYLLMFIVVSIPIIKPLNLKTYPTKPVERTWDFLENLGPDDYILLSFNYDGSTLPELQPMARAILKQAFMNDVKVLGFSFYPAGSAISQSLITQVANQFGKVDGVDFVNFGYKTPLLPIVLGMGKDIASTMGTDINGVPVDTLQIMKNLKNYDDIDLLIDFSGSSTYRTWIFYAQSKFGLDIAAGVTGVIGAEVYPYIDSGQLVGALVGLKGAAEYEQMADRKEKQTGFDIKKREFVKKYIRERDREAKPEQIKTEYEAEMGRILADDKKARAGMDAQAIAHLVILIFIILGNIGYFMSDRHKKQLKQR